MAEGGSVIYNSGFRFDKFIAPPSQDEIHNCPEYFAFSKEEIYDHKDAPEFLKRIIREFPWDGRKSVLQVRPQDWRKTRPVMLGDGWHIDDCVRLKDGKVRVCKNFDDFKLMTVSFGNVCETDFMSTILDLPDLSMPGTNYAEFFAHVATLKTTSLRPAPNQLAIYTSKDIHKVGSLHHLGKLRLMIVAFESDVVDGEGLCLPSIKERDNGTYCPKLDEYIG